MTTPNSPARAQASPPAPTADPTQGQALAQALDAALAKETSLEARLTLIAEAIPRRVSFSSSLGIEDQAILHAIAKSGAAIDVFTLDTGRHFYETLETLEASEQRYGLKIRVMFPDATEVETLVKRDGIMGFRYDIDARKACCHVRKVLPLNRALEGAAGWVTGMRREQSQGRAVEPFASWNSEHGLVKLSPIADWTLADTEAYIAANKVPINPLHHQGFPSIGCAPCTRAIRPGEDIRAGRWWWENEDGKECGLHNRPQK